MKTNYKADIRVSVKENGRARWSATVNDVYVGDGETIYVEDAFVRAGEAVSDFVYERGVE